MEIREFEKLDALMHIAHKLGWYPMWLTKSSYAKTVINPPFDYQLSANVSDASVLLSLLDFFRGRQ